MINIQFNGNTDEVNSCIDILKNELDFVVGNSDLTINIQSCPNGFSVESDGYTAILKYNKQADFNRALCFAVNSLKQKETISLQEYPDFEACAVMLDVSRGAAMKPDKIKELMRLIARMGFNQFMLYTEDTYEIEKYPYFGYMRGRYTKDELKEIVNYGNMLGIETVPCIQTLGHLESMLRWDDFSNVRDMVSVLLAEESESYILIEEMLKLVKECFTSAKIHIGMDEAFGVGLGKYLDRYGYKDRFDILTNHLNKVVKLCEKYNLEPMMWSDMFFRFVTPDRVYYHEDTKLPENIAEMIPQGVSQVYWDYYHHDEKMYDILMNQHKKLKCPVIFAGGVWIWSGPSVNYQQTFESTIPALKMCKTHGVRHVIATLWGDDGSECDAFESLLGLQLYAECNYGNEYSKEELYKNFKICTGYPAESFMLLDTDDYRLTEGEVCPETYITKQVLYQNPLIGLFDKNFEGYKLKEHYENIAHSLEAIDIPPRFELLFEYHKQLVKVLTEKCDIGIRLKKEYDKRNFENLKALADLLEQIASDIEKMRVCRMNLWFENNKPFGYEEVNNRLGAACAASSLAASRVKDFVDKKVDVLDELEQEKLNYNSVEGLYVTEPASRKMMAVRINMM